MGKRNVMKSLFGHLVMQLTFVKIINHKIIRHVQYDATDAQIVLINCGRVPHICVSKLTNTGSDNGLSPGRRQAIICTNAGILLIGPLGTIFGEISIVIHIFSFNKMHLKMSSGKWRPCCLGLNVLIPIQWILNPTYWWGPVGVAWYESAAVPVWSWIMRHARCQQSQLCDTNNIWAANVTEIQVSSTCKLIMYIYKYQPYSLDSVGFNI